MKTTQLGATLGLALLMASCTMFKEQRYSGAQTGSNERNVQTEHKNKEAHDKAASLTSGWPESSITAAKEMVSKYGEPAEKTSDTLVWRNIAPFKKIIVHKEVYSHRFPLLHQNSLQHIVDYKAPISKIDDIWRYNGSIVLDRTKGEMSSFAENEAMNILALNLAHQVMSGKMGPETARVTYGKETMNFLNGNKTAYTSVLDLGSQFETTDPGETITTKIRWIGDPEQKKAPTERIQTRQAQEEKN